MGRGERVKSLSLAFLLPISPRAPTPFSLHAPLSSPSVEEHSEMTGDESELIRLFVCQLFVLFMET